MFKSSGVSEVQRLAQTVLLVACRFGIAPDPVLDAFFVLVLVLMVHLGVEPAQIDDFVDRARDGDRAVFIAGKFSAVDCVSIGHEIILLSPVFIFFMILLSHRAVGKIKSRDLLVLPFCPPANISHTCVSLSRAKNGISPISYP
jgi:hypothetical protein